MKLVKESLNEVISFERGGDPLSKLGIGYKKQIEDWLEEMEIYNYEINKDYSIDINGELHFHGKKIEKLPRFIKFNEIKGDFYSSICQLISLKVFPNIVKGLFYFHQNLLSSLKDSPLIVGRNYACSDNELTSLKYCPEKIHADFYCMNNHLISLEEGPKLVEGDYYCYNNKKQFTFEDVRKYCDVKGKIYLYREDI